MGKRMLFSRSKTIKEPEPEKKPVTLAERHFKMRQASDAIVEAFGVLDPNDTMDRALAQILSQARSNLDVHIQSELRIGVMARAEVGVKEEAPKGGAEI